MQRSSLFGVLISTFLLTGPLTAQFSVEFTELLIDPIGPNAGAQLLEIRNTSNQPKNLSNWRLTYLGTIAELPAVTLPADQTAVVHLGQTGVDTSTDIYLPSMPTLPSSGTLSLWDGPLQGAEMEDFVSWGGGQYNMGIALALGQWLSPSESVAVPLFEGHSIAHFDRMSYGNRNRAAAWYRDGTPTIGSENDAGGLFVGAYGCPGQSPYPLFGSGEANNRPWIGEDWTLHYQTVPAQPHMMWIAIGEQTTQVPLDIIGMPGCFLGVTPYTIVMRDVPTGQGALLFDIPNNPVLVQEQFFLQGLVAWPGLNPVDLAATRVIHATVGSR